MTDKDLERQWIILKEMEELTEHVARLTGLIIQMRELFDVYNNKLEKIAYLIEEAEQYECKDNKHDIH